MNEARVEMGWLGLGYNSGERHRRLDQDSSSGDRRVWIALFIGKKGTLPLVTREKEENIGVNVLRSVGFEVGRWRFLKVI